MKRIPLLIILLALLLAGCAAPQPQADIAATTLPVWEFTARICGGTGLQVARLVTENVSCLHDYSLNVEQVRILEGAKAVVISGAGLEEHLFDLSGRTDVIDASPGVALLCGTEEDHDHQGHSHGTDAHIWLSPDNAATMAENICRGLSQQFPQYRGTFEGNLSALLEDLAALGSYGEAQLSTLSCRELITFHDGFSYLADCFGLTMLAAVEEESGSEASARELKRLITLVNTHQLPAIFTEVNGSASSAEVIARETGADCFCLDMAMSGDSYFAAMYRNIDTLKEALE